MMQTSTTGERDAAVTLDVIVVMRRPGYEGSPSINMQLPVDDITERLLDAMGLLALERVEKRETELQYHDLLQSAKQV